MMLLTDILRGGAPGTTGLVAAMSQRGGSEALDRACGKPGTVDFGWSFDLGREPLSHELSVRLSGPGTMDEVTIASEAVRRTRPGAGDARPFDFVYAHEVEPGRGTWTRGDATGSLPSRKLEVADNETLLLQDRLLLRDREFRSDLYPHYEALVRDVRAQFDRMRSYASTDFLVRELGRGSKVDLGVRELDGEGREFVNVLRHLDQRHDALDAYAERLRTVLPQLKKLKLIDESSVWKRLDLVFEDGRVFKLSEMSDGTLKAMLLAHLLSTPERMSLLFLDEPELNLHPAWMKVIARWILEHPGAEQVMVSTHSPDLLDAFTEGFRAGSVKLLVAGDKEKSLRSVGPDELESFFGEGWELGDLYRVGEPKLGGWPW